MTPRCIRCHHPMKHSRPSGMGKVCEAKSPAPIPAVERDLFYSAELVSQEIADRHLAEMRQGFDAARRRLGVWSAQ